MSSNSVGNHTRDQQIGLPLRGRPILLITRLITARIGLHSVLLPIFILSNISELWFSFSSFFGANGFYVLTARKKVFVCQKLISDISEEHSDSTTLDMIHVLSKTATYCCSMRWTLREIQTIHNNVEPLTSQGSIIQLYKFRSSRTVRFSVVIGRQGSLLVWISKPR